jgi:hypothetical protein
MGDIVKQGVEKQEIASQPLDELKRTPTIDTIHQDEALKVLGRYAGDTAWTPNDEKKLVRRIDRKLLSVLVITYGLQYYDKAMLSQAVSYTSVDELIKLCLMCKGALWFARRPES